MPNFFGWQAFFILIQKETCQRPFPAQDEPEMARESYSFLDSGAGGAVFSLNSAFFIFNTSEL